MAEKKRPRLSTKIAEAKQAVESGDKAEALAALDVVARHYADEEAADDAIGNAAEWFRETKGAWSGNDVADALEREAWKT
jgi:hypothetical protein